MPGQHRPQIFPVQAMLTSILQKIASVTSHTVYPKKYAHRFCFAVLCCGYTLTDFPISTRLTSLALWQSNDCPSASKATLMNMDKYFMWNQYERLHNHNKTKHNKTVCIFLGIYCILSCHDIASGKINNYHVERGSNDNRCPNRRVVMIMKFIFYFQFNVGRDDVGSKL